MRTSRQVRRGLRVGTCAPTPSELHGVRCHLLDLCDPGETFTRRRLAHGGATQPGAARPRGHASPWSPGARACTSPHWSTASTWRRCRPTPSGAPTARELAATPEGLARLPPSFARATRGARPRSTSAIPRRVIRALEILDAKGGSILSARRRSAARARGDGRPRRRPTDPRALDRAPHRRDVRQRRHPGRGALAARARARSRRRSAHAASGTARRSI